MTNEWATPEHALAYLARKDDFEQRLAGEATLLAEVPKESRRILDLGCGDGHLLSLVLNHCSNAVGIGLDFSPPMLKRASERFGKSVHLVEHSLDQPLPDLGFFDSIVSSFAIHHCSHERKREIYQEVFDRLEPGGVFCNLEHVSSPTEAIHEKFVQALGLGPGDEDPSNKLLDVETQLVWLREIGYADVDCYWKWRELALLIGRKPGIGETR